MSKRSLVAVTVCVGVSMWFVATSALGVDPEDCPDLRARAVARARSAPSGADRVRRTPKEVLDEKMALFRELGAATSEAEKVRIRARMDALTEELNDTGGPTRPGTFPTEEALSAMSCAELARLLGDTPSQSPEPDRITEGEVRVDYKTRTVRAGYRDLSFESMVRQARVVGVDGERGVVLEVEGDVSEERGVGLRRVRRKMRFHFRRDEYLKIALQGATPQTCSYLVSEGLACDGTSAETRFSFLASAIPGRMDKTVSWEEGDLGTVTPFVFDTNGDGEADEFLVRQNGMWRLYFDDLELGPRGKKYGDGRLDGSVAWDDEGRPVIGSQMPIRGGREIRTARIPRLPKAPYDRWATRTWAEAEDAQRDLSETEISEAELRALATHAAVEKPMVDGVIGLVRDDVATSVAEAAFRGQPAALRWFGRSQAVAGAVEALELTADAAAMAEGRIATDKLRDFYRSTSGQPFLGPDEGLYGDSRAWTEQETAKAADARAERVARYLSSLERRRRAEELLAIIYGE